MRDLSISLEQALALREQGALLVDARSPAEFEAATIPGAINVPLFDNDERHQVGLCYANEGKRQAQRLGVELVSGKIPHMVATVDAALADARPPVIVFCWRGGMRSRSLATFLQLAGFPVRQLIGGHKAFRSHVCRFFEQASWGRLLVLRGMTGVGKTRLLQRLAQENYPVIDLEGLANHRGSAFGALGLPQQPSQKMFEALLWDQLRQIPEQAYALTEGESKHIGRVVLPERVYAALQVETSLWVDASIDYRVKVILDDYPARDQLRTDFEAPIRALKERLGTARMEELLALLGKGEWEELTARLMTDYYDPLYRHTKPERRIEIAIEPEAEGMQRLRQAIAAILAVAPGEASCF